MFSTVVIAVAGVLLLIATVIPGVRLYWPQHRDPVRRSDLGIALMTGALIAFAVLAVQIMIQVRSQRDANAREEQADREALLLQLGRSANLVGLDLNEEDLSHAYLNAKDLRGTNLERASMKDASLQGSSLIGANLRGAKLDRARLDGADLRHAYLGGASLVRAQLDGANLDAAVLTPGVDLSHADLSNATARADLRLADLTDANLFGARLAPANLQGADFTDADLKFADLRGADLRGANLLHAHNLSDVKDVALARFDGSTRWPPTFTWPKTENTRPQCKKRVCTLPEDTDTLLAELPKSLVEMRDKLEAAADDRECLPGWLLEDRPHEVYASSPGDRASFSIETGDVRGTTVEAWAESFRLKNVKPIKPRSGPITADGAEKRIAYAVRVENGVHVWFSRPGGVAFHMSALASPAVLSLFERDFIKLFGAVGVEGDLFPWLRGGKDTCST